MSDNDNRFILLPVLELLDGIVLAIIASFCYDREVRDGLDCFRLADRAKLVLAVLMTAMAVGLLLVRDFPAGLVSLLAAIWSISLLPKYSRVLPLDRKLTHRRDQVPPVGKKVRLPDEDDSLAEKVRAALFRGEIKSPAEREMLFSRMRRGLGLLAAILATTVVPDVFWPTVVFFSGYLIIRYIQSVYPLFPPLPCQG